MCIGPGLTNIKGLGCLGGQGKHSNKGYDGRHLERWQATPVGYYYLPNILYCMRDFTRRRGRQRRRLRQRGQLCPMILPFMAILIGAAHLRVERSPTLSCRGLAPIGPCCADMLQRVEAVVSSVSDAFNEYIRQAAICTGTSTSSQPAPVADSKVPTPDVPV
ncbi:hypothetical protein M9H77_12042 [Catharanthus roseus]|uniref:Uncharacterized protein n=1 Tax=Catharanthus roseus TaxID=4058 RepID=A0ACC0BGG8_CATRO|nr:hypothetical protein M9H77_12042 [Catharanthus roseus]